ncbi:proline iminopeptidase [Salmonella enterica subsp. enterica serovar Typhi str. STH2370]|nr:proline iminopeptidase [Salmonella enterica subsp. enterica serovar Typhi str. STH2370]
MRSFNAFSSCRRVFLDYCALSPSINPINSSPGYWARVFDTGTFLGRNACRRARLLTACRASRDDTGQFAADPTGYHILWGTNELAANGKLADWDITPHLCQIRCPVLVLRGENDQATERVVSPLLSHISDCRAVTIPGSSHNPHEENIAPCLAEVSAFLRDLA